jgi:hypothetical protein
MIYKERIVGSDRDCKLIPRHNRLEELKVLYVLKCVLAYEKVRIVQKDTAEVKPKEGIEFLDGSIGLIAHVLTEELFK